MKLQGKVAVIVGGGSGMGATTAELFAAVERLGGGEPKQQPDADKATREPGEAVS